MHYLRAALYSVLQKIITYSVIHIHGVGVILPTSDVLLGRKGYAVLHFCQICDRTILILSLGLSSL
jgi:hypothetical protein